MVFTHEKPNYFSLEGYMSKILFVNVCTRECSRTLELANYVVNKLDGDIEQLKLYDIELAPVDLQKMEIRDKAKAEGDFSAAEFDLAKQFANADTIVIAAPYWDLMFPSLLKVYFENITVNGLTFFYNEKGIPQGLCKAERLIYVTTAGGHIVHNFGFEYASSLAKAFYGIKRVECVSAEGLDILGADVEAILNKAKDSFI
jgi:FMN-dependent NADH-azoreductase